MFVAPLMSYSLIAKSCYLACGTIKRKPDNPIRSNKKDCTSRSDAVLFVETFRLQ